MVNARLSSVSGLRRPSGVRFDYRLDLPDQSGSGRVSLQAGNTVEGDNRV